MRLNANVHYRYLIPQKVFNTIPEITRDMPKIPGYRESYLLEVLSLISSSIRKKENKDQGEAPLKMVYLRKLIPQADQYINWLIKKGVIKKSGSYKPGVKSFNYGFTTQYESQFKIFDVTDPKLILRLNKNHLRRENSKKYPEQNHYLRLMTIDPGALQFIETNTYSNLNEYNYSLASVVKIINKQIYYLVDSTAGRFHSNLTNLPSELRQFIRVKGERLSNIDIKNSQPYFLTILLTQPAKASRFAKDKNFRMLLESLQGIEAPDISLYTSLVKTGQLYEYLQGEFKKSGFDYSREDAKGVMFKLLFDQNKNWTRQREIFSRLFPGVHERACELKGNWRGKNKFRNYKRLSILLQSIEAYLILDTVIPRIYREYPGIVALTIHDSLMVYTNNIETVKKIMDEELTRFVGFPPILNIEKNEKKVSKEFAHTFLTQNTPYSLNTQELRGVKSKERGRGESPTNTVLEPF